MRVMVVVFYTEHKHFFEAKRKFSCFICLFHFITWHICSTVISKPLHRTSKNEGAKVRVEKKSEN